MLGLAGEGVFCPKIKSFVCRGLEEKQQEPGSSCSAAASAADSPQKLGAHVPGEPGSPT